MRSWTENSLASYQESGHLMLPSTLLKKIGNIEDNHNTVAVFLDLAKAFNSISHEILPKKTEKTDLAQEISISLYLQFYSSNLVKLGIDFSDKKIIYHDVLKGNVSGPLFFCYMPTIVLKNWKVKLILFNLQIILVLYAKLKVIKKIH